MGFAIEGIRQAVGRNKGLVPIEDRDQVEVSGYATTTRLDSLLKLPDSPDLRQYCYPHPHERPVF